MGTIFGSKLGIAVVNKDGPAYLLNAETGVSDPIHDAKVTMHDDGGYSVIGTHLSIYGDSYGDIGQTSEGVTFYSAITGERIHIPGGKVTLKDDGSWKVVGQYMTIIGEANGHYSITASRGMGTTSIVLLS